MVLMDENVRTVLSEVGPYSDKDTLPGVLLIFGSLNYLKMHIIIIMTVCKWRHGRHVGVVKNKSISLLLEPYFHVNPLK